jgi:hypothetical protein
MEIIFFTVDYCQAGNALDWSDSQAGNALDWSDSQAGKQRA